jgi:PAS domain-containing protein
MEYQGLTVDDLANVRALNGAWLRLTGRDERLAAAPFLLFSIREHDAAFWERLLAGGGQHELFSGQLASSDARYGLHTAALGFLWELSRRNPYVARIVGGAPLDWCQRIASETLLRVLDCAVHRELVQPRFPAEAVVYRRVSAHMAALQSMLTLGIDHDAVQLPAAACRMTGPVRRVSNKV